MEDVKKRDGVPAWVKVSLVIIVVLVVAFVIATVTGIGGEHRPNRHGGVSPSSSVVDDGKGHRSPVDHDL